MGLQLVTAGQVHIMLKTDQVLYGKRSLSEMANSSNSGQLLLLIRLALVSRCVAFSAAPLRLASSRPALYSATCTRSCSFLPASFEAATILCAEPSGGDVDEAYYSVSAIRGRQAVSNAERGGMVWCACACAYMSKFA